MVANEKDTKHQALKRALTASENENNYDWSLPDAVRQAFMDGVALAERVRLVRFAGAGVAPSEGSRQQQLQRVWETQNALAQHAKAVPPSSSLPSSSPSPSSFSHCAVFALWCVCRR